MFRNNGRTSNRQFHNPPKRKIIDIRVRQLHQGKTTTTKVIFFFKDQIVLMFCSLTMSDFTCRMWYMYYGKVVCQQRLIGVTPPEFKYCPSYSQSNLNRASTPTTPKPGSPVSNTSYCYQRSINLCP